jgi:hypothetical protein
LKNLRSEKKIKWLEKKNTNQKQTPVSMPKALPHLTFHGRIYKDVTEFGLITK